MVGLSGSCLLFWWGRGDKKPTSHLTSYFTLECSSTHFSMEHSLGARVRAPRPETEYWNTGDILLTLKSLLPSPSGKWVHQPR